MKAVKEIAAICLAMYITLLAILALISVAKVGLDYTPFIADFGVYAARLTVSLGLVTVIMIIGVAFISLAGSDNPRVAAIGMALFALFFAASMVAMFNLHRLAMHA